MLHSTWLVAMEVPNGGFNQFFWNHDARFAVLARDGFTLIGAHELASLMERVIRIRGLEEKDPEPFHREGTAEAFAESYEHSSLDELDSLFYKLDDEGRSLRIRYVRTHPEAFVDR